VAQARAIVGDPRNDENVIVSQLQGLFLRFPQFVANQLPNSSSLDVQREVRSTTSGWCSTISCPRLLRTKCSTKCCRIALSPYLRGLLEALARPTIPIASGTGRRLLLDLEQHAGTLIDRALAEPEVAREATAAC
jgi:hypothetical protein